VTETAAEEAAAANISPFERGEAVKKKRPRADLEKRGMLSSFLLLSLSLLLLLI